MLDVLEHVENDVVLLRELAQTALRPAGRVILSVPAWPNLYVRHDSVLGHYRRYRPETLAAAMHQAGLRIDRQGSLFTSLLLLRVSTKLLEVCRGTRSAPGVQPALEHAATDASNWRRGPLITRLVQSLLTLDCVLMRPIERAGVRVPGLSLWAMGSTERTVE